MLSARLVSGFQALAAVVWSSLMLGLSTADIHAAAPTAITLSSYTLMENSNPGVLVALIGAVDADPGDTFTFQLVEGAGSSDNGGFLIFGNQLVAPYGVSIEGVNVDFETTPRVFPIRIRVTDSTGNSFEQAIVIQMTDDRAEDVDGDGLTEAQEEDIYGTSDLIFDTDGDGVGDGLEIAGGTSPINSGSWPTSCLVGWGDNFSRQLGGPGDADTLSIVTGQTHSLALRTDGTVRAWAGGNSFGQITVPAGLSGVVAVAAGGDFWVPDSAFSLALKNDDTITAWGCNTSGQIDVPSGLGPLITLAAGRAHSLALKADGTVAAWGQNNYGQTAVPEGLSNVVAISAGGYHSLALKSDGKVVAWGSTFDGETWIAVAVPTGLRDVVAISAGRFHSLALKSDGTVVAWGYNMNAQTTVPSNLSGVVSVSAGGFHSLALKSDGSVVAWGLNSAGQNTVPPAARSNVKQISAGMLHSLALYRSSGFPEITSSPVLSMLPGDVVSHQITVANATPSAFFAVGLPDGLTIHPSTGLISGSTSTASRRSALVRVQTDKGIVSQTLWLRFASGVAATDLALSPSTVLENSADASPVGVLSATDSDPGDTHSFELVSGAGSTDNSRFRVSGSELIVNGSLARDFESSAAPFSIRVRALDSSLNAFEKIVSIQILDDRTEDADGDGLTEAQEEDQYGTSDSAYDSDGDGYGDSYEVHHGSLASSSASTPSGTLLVKWGSNANGQTTEPANLGDVLDVAAGWQHSLALRTDGTVIAWGRNNEGQSTVPETLSGIVAIEAGDYHSLALKNDGTVTAWGGDDDGQSDVPVDLSNVIAIAAGAYHNLALKRDGTVVGWGYDEYGQATVPVGLSEVVAIAAGGFHSLAIKSDGSVVAWGTAWAGLNQVPAEPGRSLAITAGTYSSFKVDARGEGTAWGADLSQGVVAGNLSNIAAVASGWAHSVILKKDGTVHGWGDDSEGQTDIPLEARQLKRLVAGDYHNLALRRATGFPEITNAAEITAWPGDVVSHPITTTGAVPSHFEAMGLPVGLAIDSVTGLVTGTVTTGEKKSVRVMVDTDKGRLTRLISFDTSKGVAPTAIALAGNSVTENATSGTLVGTLSATDANAGDTFTFSLSVSGDTVDNSYFTLSGNQLLVGTGFDRDYEANPAPLSVRVRVTDAGQNEFEQLLSVTLLDDRAEDADGDGVDEGREEDLFLTSDGVPRDYVTADTDKDGVPNLIEYAFNLNLNGSDSPRNLGGAGSTSGLPIANFTTDGQGNQRLQLEYLRRIGSGITYLPQFSSALSTTTWQAATQPVQVTPVNGSWERCSVMDSQISTSSAKRFARVGVTP